MNNRVSKNQEIDLSPCVGADAFAMKLVIYIVKLESSSVSIYCIKADGLPSEWSLGEPTRFTPPSFHSHDQNGYRLLEEVVRRLKDKIDKSKRPDLIVVSTPGTIRENQIIARASRLGITEPINVAEYIQNELHCSVLVMRDTDASAAGEIYFGNHVSADKVINQNLDFAVIMVGEGVGMSLIQNWRVTRGAGAAGAIGRLVVEPNGQFNKSYRQRGNLETCVAIPWLSRSIVEEYLIHNDKLKLSDQCEPQMRRMIEGAVHKEMWESIPVEAINVALNATDPIVYNVMRKAATYLARVLCAIIAINNPALIILTGELIEKTDSYFDMLKQETHKLSWGKAWERTTLSKSTSSQKHEVLGASYIGYKFIRGNRSECNLPESHYKCG